MRKILGGWSEIGSPIAACEQHMGSQNRNLAVNETSRTGSGQPTGQDGFRAVFLFSVATNGSVVTPWRQGETLILPLDDSF